MNEPTPRPWSFDLTVEEGVTINGPQGQRIAVVSDEIDEVDANSRFIVRAANSYSALLAALEAVEWVFAIGRETGHKSSGKQCPSCRRWRIPPSERHPNGINEGHAPDCKLSAALRAAKGE